MLERITSGNSEDANPEKIYYYQEGIECEPEEVNITSTAYPIPFNSVITVESELLTGSNATIDLLDMSGRLLLSKVVSSRIAFYQLAVPPLPGGIYFLRIRSNEHMATVKIIKK